MVWNNNCTVLVGGFVGVADQLQSNYASDLRHMLKSVFDSFTSDVTARLDAVDSSTSLDTFHRQAPDTNSRLSSRTVTSVNSAPNYNNLRTAAGSMLGKQYYSAAHNQSVKWSLLFSVCFIANVCCNQNIFSDSFVSVVCDVLKWNICADAVRINSLYVDLCTLWLTSIRRDKIEV